MLKRAWTQGLEEWAEEVLGQESASVLFRSSVLDSAGRRRAVRVLSGVKPDHLRRAALWDAQLATHGDQVPGMNWVEHVLSYFDEVSFATVDLDGEPLGFIEFLEHRQVPHYSAVPATVFHHIETAPHSRRDLAKSRRYSGVGRLLVRAAIAKSMRDGHGGEVHYLALERERAFAERLGFTCPTDEMVGGYSVLGASRARRLLQRNPGRRLPGVESQQRLQHDDRQVELRLVT